MFNEEERKIAIARIRNENADGLDESQTQTFWVSFKKAFTIHSTLCIIGYSCINVSVQGLATFMPTVIRTLGRYSAIEIQLRTVPPFAVSAVWSVLISYLSWKIQKRGIWIMISIPMGILVRVSSILSAGHADTDELRFSRATSSSLHPWIQNSDMLDASFASWASCLLVPSSSHGVLTMFQDQSPELSRPL